MTGVSEGLRQEPNRDGEGKVDQSKTGKLELASFPGCEPAGFLGQTQWTGVLLGTVRHTMGERGTSAGWNGVENTVIMVS